MNSNKYKIAGISTREQGVRCFMLSNLRYVAQNGFKPYIICEPSDILLNEDLTDVVYNPISMQRGNVTPFEVLRSIYRLYVNFKKNKYHIIQYTSSNASLYASIAGWLAHVPVRIYCQWGISYTDYSGLKFLFYKFMEKVTCFFSTDVQPDSFANLKYSIKEGLYKKSKGSVIHKGSANGVDMRKFDILKKADWREEIRNTYNITSDAFVFGFVGRLVPEKGIDELFEAFSKIIDSNVKLMIVGPYYQIDRLNQSLYNDAQKNPNIIFVGPVSNPSKYYAALDFLVLPSYREGFGSVILEAASIGVPSICSNIKGPTDFIKDGENGILCEVMSVDSLFAAMNKALYLKIEDYRTMSENVYNDVKRDYDALKFQQYFLEDRLKLLIKHNVKL